MAVLENLGGGAAVVLEPRHLVGRSTGNDTRILGPAVSGEHALFLWTGNGWELRDLGSRNGTWVGDRQLRPGDRLNVAAGAKIAFGDPQERWILTTDSAPSAVAWAEDRVIEGEGRFLGLPDADDPRVLVELDHEAGWVVVRDGAPRAAVHGEILEIDGREFRLGLPGGRTENVPQTAELKEISLDKRVDVIGLDFAVSADEEYIEVTARLAATAEAIKPRAHHELLLVLARRRLEDAAEGVAASEQGWVYTSDVRTMLRISANQFYVMSHRCRKELEDLGVVDAGRIIEKRTTSRQVRIGVADLTVRAL